jgi:hypothetical protein
MDEPVDPIPDRPKPDTGHFTPETVTYYGQRINTLPRARLLEMICYFMHTKERDDTLHAKGGAILTELREARERLWPWS